MIVTGDPFACLRAEPILHRQYDARCLTRLELELDRSGLVEEASVRFQPILALRHFVFAASLQEDEVRDVEPRDLQGFGGFGAGPHPFAVEQGPRAEAASRPRDSSETAARPSRDRREQACAAPSRPTAAQLTRGRRPLGIAPRRAVSKNPRSDVSVSAAFPNDTELVSESEFLHYNSHHAKWTWSGRRIVIAPPRKHSHTRRDFFSRTLGRALGSVPLMDLAFYRASWTRALAQNTAPQKVFHIQKAADGVYFAEARTQAVIISSAVIFVNARDVLVVDSQTSPSASAALIGQIKKEVTEKPVRYVVNTHFHDDHSQGNAAFKHSFPKVDFIATKVTAELIAKEVPVRLKETLEKSIPESIEKVRGLSAKAATAAEKAFWAEQLRQYKAFQAEMKNFELELPTITFEDKHVIRDRDHELQIGFHGRSHTAGDVVVFLSAETRPGHGRHDQRQFALHARCVSEGVGENNRLGESALMGSGPFRTRTDYVAGARRPISQLHRRDERPGGEGKRAGKSLDELKKSDRRRIAPFPSRSRLRPLCGGDPDSLFPHWGRTFVNIKENFQDAVNGVTANCFRRIDFG